MKFLKIFKSKLFIFIVVAGLCIAGFMYLRPLKGNALQRVDFITLEKGDLVDSISVKGVVESIDSKNVYATSGYQITDVLVSVGDRVTKGQLLLHVDTQELESQISQQRAALSKQSESNLVALENSKRIYNEAVSNFEQSKDSSLISSKSRIETAEINLQIAKKNYDDKVSEYENSEISQIISAENTLRNAEIDLDNKKTDFETSKVLYDAGTIAKSEFDKAEIALVASQNTYDDALKAIETTKSSIESEIEKLRQNVETAEVSYKEALDSLNSTEISLKQNIDKYEDNIKTAEVSINQDADLIAISNLESKLEKAVVTAPISGVITACYAKEGSNAQGLMFVIEDIDNLKILTKIKEFDSNKVMVGMPVSIHSDATGDDVYEGQISKIAPTSIKDSQGQALATGDVEFETEISVISDNTGLKVGMNAKLDIILEKRTDVLYVTFDTVVKNENDEDVVYVIAEDELGELIAKEKKIEIIKETDFYLQIEGLEEGERIITDATLVQNDMKITLEDIEQQQGPMAGGIIIN